MKKAVAYLIPYLESEMNDRQKKNAGKVLLATVKGDVHDIGKNIVAVVLGCNNYDIIDLGVMTPAEKILNTAREHNVDAIGLSGLITPSLDEMVHVAREMQRLQFNIPLLIGGATTSLVHTAVKIAPNYAGPTIYVLDASRAVGVINKLLDPDKNRLYLETIQKEYSVARHHFEQRHSVRQLLPIEEARRRRMMLKWSEKDIKAPTFLGIKTFMDYPLTEIRQRIDWTPFFAAWELKGKFPQILDDKRYGSESRKLHAEANELLDQIIEKQWLTARAIIGLFPANAVGDDVEIFIDKDRKGVRAVIHTLRQQGDKGDHRENLALADFIAPIDSGLIDFIGLFIVTAGIGAGIKVREYEKKHDDYSAILIKALADRLAEAFAERMHERVRTEFWGYAPNEKMDNADLIAEKYRGIRPAPGYPACPDHSEKSTIFEILQATQSIDVKLTENFAMQPAASVSGYYFAHPRARYFGVGKINRSQVTDYARRKGIDTAQAEKWLAHNLDYK